MKKTNKEQIDELYEIIRIQNKEINNLKTNLDNMKNKLENLNAKYNSLEKRMNGVEDNHKEILKKKKYESNIIFNTKSNIIKSLDDIDFIIER